MIRIKNARILSERSTKLVDIISDNEKIVRVGKTRAAHYERDYDARGKIVLPGLIDCHVHLFSVGEMKEMIDLNNSRSIEEIQKRIKDASQKKGWILGRGWDQDILREKRLPVKEDIDAVTGNCPAIMVRVCGHIAVLNSAAIKQVTELSKFGTDRVPRSETGEYTGIVKEEALSLCWSKTPEPDSKARERHLLRAQSDALRFGLIGAHLILSEDWRKELAVLKKLERRKKLLLKLSLFLPISALEIVERMKQREAVLNGSRFITLGFKVFADGSLGARTAALDEPYSGDASNCGILSYTTDQLAELASRIRKLGMIMATHAIGDRAISQVLDALEIAKINLRDGFRIEHCSVLNKTIMDRLKNVVVSVQPSFAASDYWIWERLGKDKKRHPYAFRSILEKASKVVGGSDAPVESLDPLEGIRSAINNPVKSQRLRPLAAINLYSKNAARISPLYSNDGKIAAGFNCNLAILNVCDEHKMALAIVEQVILEGRPLHNL